MRFIADFHIHSHFSLATSKELIPEWLDYWARVKGITVVGTGDFTHPGWIKELKEKLEPAEAGLFKLKNEFRKPNNYHIPGFEELPVRFMLTAEISNIYKKNDKTRKVHNLLFAPDFETVECIQQALLNMGGNITSDGRPILGMDSKNLLELTLEANENSFFVPAHIWTPWFSVLGSKSGFDTVEECFEDLTPHIHAVETGLSSDAPMNWMCSILDKFTLLSNSDAHSPEKLGRNGNLFDTEISYPAIISAIKNGMPDEFPGTIDLFPQEGKYHYNGHRKCQVCQDPVETLRHDGICKVCGRPLTIGVVNRVVELSDRSDIMERPNRAPFQYVIPLKELISEITGKGVNTKGVNKSYFNLLQKAGSELSLLLEMPPEEIKKQCNPLIAEAIRRMRTGEVYIKEGFDGEYGVISAFAPEEIKSSGIKDALFYTDTTQLKNPPKKRRLINFDLSEYRELAKYHTLKKPENSPGSKGNSGKLKGLNPDQQAAATHEKGPALVIAGPGTGKTHTLAFRIAWLVKEKNIAPENILAVTFTNKAAEEMLKRTKSLINDDALSEKLNICTFHALGYRILKENTGIAGRKNGFTIIDEENKKYILSKYLGISKNRTGKIAAAIAAVKQTSMVDWEDEEIVRSLRGYEDCLKQQQLFDLDDLVKAPLDVFNEHPQIRDKYSQQFQYMMVDEYQDVNRLQYKLIKALMPEDSPDLCVIGDPNQAIYGFRGANVEYIRRFIKDYPEAKVFKLMKSYRCTDRILQASEHIVKGLSENGGFLQGLKKGIKIKIASNPSEKSEAEFVARTIEKMMGGLRFFSLDSKIVEGSEDGEMKSLSEFAVLCRTARQIPAIEKAFNDHSIPCQIIGEQPFYRKEPVNTVFRIWTLLNNPENQFLSDVLAENPYLDFADFSALNTIKNQPLKEQFRFIINNYLEDHMEEYTLQFRRLLEFTESYSDTEHFIRHIALGTSADMYNRQLERVPVMTMHAAKGLEFECVFVTGCEDGLIPYTVFKNQQTNTDEEKRLLYVAMTRARKYLFLTHAKQRFLFNREWHFDRSPFVDSIEEELTENAKTGYKKQQKTDDNQLSLF